MKIRKGDKVKIIKGKDKGKVATVTRVYNKSNEVLVEGVNMVKKHVKPGTVSQEGGIISIEKPIKVENVMFFNDKLGRPVRLGHKIIDGKKYRICKVSNEVIDEK